MREVQEPRPKGDGYHANVYIVYKPSSSFELLSQCESKDIGTKMKLAR